MKRDLYLMKCLLLRERKNRLTLMQLLARPIMPRDKNSSLRMGIQGFFFIITVTCVFHIT